MTTPAPTAKHPQTKTQQRDSVAHSYGFNLAFMNSDPDLKNLFAKATADGIEYAWTKDQFTAALQNTQWFKTHSSAWRQASYESVADATTFKAKTATTRADLAKNAAKMGAVLSDKELDNLTHKVQWLGWDSSQQDNFLSGYVGVAHSGPLKGQYLGDAGANADALQKLAAANGYTINDKQLQQWNQAIGKGSQTVENYGDFMRRQAAVMFPSFSDELLAGQNMHDVANPYINSMANVLEMNPQAITLKDPTLRRALSSPDPKTGKPAAMGIADFEQSLRSDARWQHTDNAKQSAATTVLGIGRIMGLQ